MAMPNALGQSSHCVSTITAIILALAIVFSSTTQAADSEKQETVKAIRDKIRRLIILPPKTPLSITVVVDVLIQDNGYLSLLKLSRTSGYPEYDKAVLAAIINAQPLPLPKTIDLRKDFQELNLRFTPGDNPNR